MHGSDCCNECCSTPCGLCTIAAMLLVAGLTVSPYPWSVCSEVRRIFVCAWVRVRGCVCVCVCVCVRVCEFVLYVRACMTLYVLYVRVLCVCVCVCVHGLHACMHACLCTRACVCVRIQLPEVDMPCVHCLCFMSHGACFSCIRAGALGSVGLFRICMYTA